MHTHTIAPHYRMGAFMLWMPLHADGLARHNPEMNILKMNLLTLLKNRAHYNSQLQRQCIATETVLKATFSS